MKIEHGRNGSSIDYDTMARKYDDVRSGNPEVIERLVSILSPLPGSIVLDVGCGTGTNTVLFSKLTAAHIIGLDLSHEMLCKARPKLPSSELIRGEANTLPFQQEVFDYAFMMEVIHHLPEKDTALDVLESVLKSKGEICIVTQSHKQIEERMTSRFFPTTVVIDQNRYPTISELEKLLSMAGFVEVSNTELTLPSGGLSADFFECVKNKGYSMLHKVSELEYESGLHKLKATMKEQTSLSYSLGYTFVHGVKP